MTIQSFNVQGGKDVGRQNLPKLRAELLKRGLDGFYVPHDDAYLNEYVPAAFERLLWVTGFSGSAGAAIILTDSAAVFSDGRYTRQLEAQTDIALFERVDLHRPGVNGWLEAQSLNGHRIGYDPHLITPNALKNLELAASKAGAAMVAVVKNPVDTVWVEQPPLPTSVIRVHDLQFAGESHADKCKRIGKSISDSGADACIITSPSSIAWLFNIRGNDVACTPLVLARAIIHANGKAQLFADTQQVSDALLDHLGPEIVLRPLSELEGAMAALGGMVIAADDRATPVWFFDQIRAADAQILPLSDPVALPRARKNQTELAGMRAAHKRDGVAVCRFLHWLDTHAPSGEIDEIMAVAKLEEFRHQTGLLQDIPFDTISGAGPNGAIIHYRVSTETNRKLEPASLFLVDSGGQYSDGTTDITRTLAIGTPSAEMREQYTRVLRGHIALSIVRFPEATTGSHLDVLARQFLWKDGFDYAHGTGHGVGAYLGVHEGPQSISRALNSVSLEPGMVVSNEPGYYKGGAFGIRIENLQYVTEPTKPKGGEIAMMGFQILTLVPYARDLIETDKLTSDERAFIDAYHADVYHHISPQLDSDAKAWLKAACARL